METNQYAVNVHLKIKNKMKTTAEIHLTVMCDCPHCKSYINIYSDLSGQCINIFEYANTEDEVDVKCPECKKYFDVEIQY